jgi:hypothetical protein
MASGEMSSAVRRHGFVLDETSALQFLDHLVNKIVYGCRSAAKCPSRMQKSTAVSACAVGRGGHFVRPVR